VTIDVLPDVALLEIFDFYVDEAWVEEWYTLVHVCRKWRNVIFGSPRRLNLRLHCTVNTPVREMLDVWPLLPMTIWGDSHEMWGMDNIVAALEHNDRIRELALFDIPSSELEKVLAAMQRPFPALTDLQLEPIDETAPVDLALFLGGSAPHLRTLILKCIPFPGLPKLLLSTTHLVHLNLYKIPDSGYISPESIVAMLTSLETFVIGFKSPRSYPDRRSRRPPPPARTPLPVLTELRFKGVSEYLEDLVARIDAPLLDKLTIVFFHHLISDTPQLAQFISRTPKFKGIKAHDEARVFFSDSNVSVTLPQPSDGVLELRISCSQSDWQLSSMAQVCSFSFPQALIPTVEHLYIGERGFPQLRWQDDVESNQWLEVLRPFTAVKSLYISQEFTPRIAPTLQELVGERVTEVLPALQTLFLENPPPSGPASVQEAIGQFVAGRHSASHPIAVSRWERDKSIEY
jgi:hypothetical protein